MSDPVPPSRTSRSAERERRRRVEAAVVASALVVLLIVVLVRSGNGSGATPNPSASDTTSPVPGPGELVALSVTGAPKALVASVGSANGLPSAAVVLPSAMTVTMPGAGEVTTRQLQELPGDSMRVGVSNVDGVWNEHYAVIDLERLGGIVDRLGTLTVDLQDVYTAGRDVFGPGPTQLTGAQVVSLLDEDADDTDQRWVSVLEALLTAAPTLAPSDFAETDDAQAAAQILGAGAAEVSIVPTQIVGGSALIPAQPQWDELMGDLYGTEVPIRAEVRNGNGQPGVGEDVGADLIPAGFRIVLSENADTFDHQTTQIIAAGSENEPAAQDARDALGLGKVIVSQVASGLADVTIVVGKDYG